MNKSVHNVQKQVTRLQNELQLLQDYENNINIVEATAKQLNERIWNLEKHQLYNMNMAAKLRGCTIDPIKLE